MMTTRELKHSPQILPLYLRAAATLVPGAGRLPGLPGGGGEIPDLELLLRDAALDAETLQEYRAVCAFASSDAIPGTFLHIPAFPLHMALMSDGRFPFAAVGLVHVENEITQLRSVRAQERLNLRVHAGALEPHPRGRTFSIFTDAHVDGEPVWRERSTMLRRGGGSSAAAETEKRGAAGEEQARSGEAAETAAGTPVTWQVPEDIGRRYGAVSGDRNPIHLHAFAAKAFGFPRAIAHGMWTKARCLAALEDELPESYTVAVAFRKPVLLPASVSFSWAREGQSIGFALRDARDAEVVHLEGRVEEGGRPGSRTAAEVGAGHEQGGSER
jgi:acyl dehydratase